MFHQSDASCFASPESMITRSGTTAERQGSMSADHWRNCPLYLRSLAFRYKQVLNNLKELADFRSRRYTSSRRIAKQDVEPIYSQCYRNDRGSRPFGSDGDRQHPAQAKASEWWQTRARCVRWSETPLTLPGSNPRRPTSGKKYSEYLERIQRTINYSENKNNHERRTDQKSLQLQEKYAALGVDVEKPLKN